MEKKLSRCPHKSEKGGALPSSATSNHRFKFKMRRMEEENALFVELEKNIADEAEAREGYYRLLSNFGHLFSEKELDDFIEIIAEELKHTNLLNAMIQRRNGIIAEK